jgi:GDP-fucose transporter C1
MRAASFLADKLNVSATEGRLPIYSPLKSSKTSSLSSSATSLSDSSHDSTVVVPLPTHSLIKSVPPTTNYCEELKVGFSVSFYIVIAIIMVLLNKAVLNIAPQLPFTLLYFQILISVVLLHVSNWTGFMRLPHLELGTCKALIPLIVVNVVGLSLNTLCLGYIDASLYQVSTLTIKALSSLGS